MSYTRYSSQYITNAHTNCAMNGCQYMDALKCLTAAQQVLDQAKAQPGRKTRTVPSEWCEKAEPVCLDCDQMTPVGTCPSCGLDAMCANCERCDSAVCLDDLYGRDDYGDDDE